MPKRTACLIAVILISAAIPATSAAHNARRTPLSIALAHAYQLWHIKPCGGHYRVEMTTLPEWAGGHTEGCTIQLQATYWTAEEVSMIWAPDCTTVLHEWGHALGYWHTDEGLPAQPGMTPEQIAVMRSGGGNYSDDLTRCGQRP